MMFTNENLGRLKNYYDEVAKSYKGSLPLRVLELPLSECFDIDRLSIESGVPYVLIYTEIKACLEYL